MISWLRQYKKSRTRGFTLVEMLVYIAIFVTVTTASVTFLLSLNAFIDQYRLETMLYRSGTSVMEQVLLAIRQADRVELAGTVEDSPSAGKLTVENDTTTTVFTLAGNELQLTVDGMDYGNLLMEGVVANKFTVYYYPLSQGGEYVRVRLDLTGSIDVPASKSLTLYGGAVVRGAVNH